jgi:hypothetical protein
LRNTVFPPKQPRLQAGAFFFKLSALSHQLSAYLHFPNEGGG